MATSCATCGAKLGFGRRLTGKALCETCEKQEQVRRQEEDRRRAEARAEYVALAARTGNDESIALRLAALAERAAFSPADRRAAGMAALTTLIERVVGDELLGEDEESDMMVVMNRLDLTVDDFRATLEPFGNRVAIARMAVRQSAESSFAKLLGVNVFDDGIQFHVSNRKIAQLFRVADGYFVAAPVNAVVQRAA